jgi:hypothetical protein
VTLSPVVGYSGTPLPAKLGIKPGSVTALLGAPDDFEATLGPLPDGARLRRSTRGGPDLVVAFVRSRAELSRRWDAAARTGAPVWVAWPKKASGVATDLDEHAVRGHGLARGWVDHKVAAIDATWSGLRFARRTS